MNPAQSDYILGVFLLLIVIFEWTANDFLTQGIYQGGFVHPFLVTYVNTGSFSLFLLPFLFRNWRAGRKSPFSGSVESSGSSRGDYSHVPSDESPPEVVTRPSAISDPLPLTLRETAQLALLFSLCWFIGNWSGKAALNFTSVASSTILGSMSGFFTLGIGWFLGVETITLLKLVAVSISTFGVGLVSLADSSAVGISGQNITTLTNEVSINPSYSDPLLGDFLALLSGLFYALFVTLLKVRVGDESRVDMTLFLGFVGIFSLVSFWPIGVLLHYAGIEPFEWPNSTAVWANIAINVLVTLTSDYLYPLAMLKTNPLVVTVGMSLTIPFALIGDWLVVGVVAAWTKIIGAILVLGSFVTLGIEGAQRSDAEQREGFEGVDIVRGVEPDTFE